MGKSLVSSFFDSRCILVFQIRTFHNWSSPCTTKSTEGWESADWLRLSCNCLRLSRPVSDRSSWFLPRCMLSSTWCIFHILRSGTNRESLTVIFFKIEWTLFWLVLRGPLKVRVPHGPCLYLEYWVIRHCVNLSNFGWPVMPLHCCPFRCRGLSLEDLALVLSWRRQAEGKWVVTRYLERVGGLQCMWRCGKIWRLGIIGYRGHVTYFCCSFNMCEYYKCRPMIWKFLSFSGYTRAGVVICLEQGADLHMAQLMPLPLTVSCFSKIQLGFSFLVPAHPGSPGQRAVRPI